MRPADMARGEAAPAAAPMTPRGIVEAACRRHGVERADLAVSRSGMVLRARHEAAMALRAAYPAMPKTRLAAILGISDGAVDRALRPEGPGRRLPAGGRPQLWRDVARALAAALARIEAMPDTPPAARRHADAALGKLRLARPGAWTAWGLARPGLGADGGEPDEHWRGER